MALQSHLGEKYVFKTKLLQKKFSDANKLLLFFKFA